MQFNVHLSQSQRIIIPVRLRTFFVLVTMFVSTSGVGKVYTLAPGRGNASGGAVQNIESKTFWSEPVVINGVKMQLNIGLINKRLDLLLPNIRRFFPGAKFLANNNTLLIVQKLKDGSEKRFLLMYFGAGMPILQFSIQIPRKLPRNFTWPNKLPMTHDGKPHKYIALPNQNVWYGIFRTSGHREIVLGEMSSKLEGDGWKPLSSSLNSGKETGGEMFYRKKPPGIMIINCSPDGVATSFYHPVSKK